MAPLFSSFYCPQCEQPKAKSTASQVVITPEEFALGVVSRLPFFSSYRHEPHLDGKLMTVHFTKQVKPPLGWSYVYEVPVVIKVPPSFADIEYWVELLK